jgi:acetyl esterase/lipase
MNVMRHWRRILVGASIVLGLAATIGLRLLLGETNLDRNQGDYRSRMHAIWPGPAPGSPDPKRLSLDLDSGVLSHLFVNELDEAAPYLVAFPASGVTRAPALLLLPGGGYSFRSEKLDGLDIAEWFSARGIASFVLNYRVDPYRYPVPLRDAERAVRWLRAHSAEQHIDPERIAVFGTSAGGHLAALLATEDGSGDPQQPDLVERQSSRPNLLILAQAVISLEQFVHEGSRRHLLGDAPSLELLHALSADQRVNASTPPTFIWTTRTDEFVDYRNSELFVQALRNAGVDHEYRLFATGRHGRGLARIEGSRDWPRLCLEWLQRHGFTGEDRGSATGSQPATPGVPTE